MNFEVDELRQRLDAARQIALEAGALLLSRLGRAGEVSVKRTAVDLVTDTDRDAEKIIVAGLTAMFHGEPICAEETDGSEGAAARKTEIEAARWAWCVDPLDGTTNFVHGYPSFCVSIGLLHRGHPVGGVVHAPARNETFHGGQGLVITLEGAQIQVSKTASLQASLIATGFPHDRIERLDHLLPVLRRVLETAHGIRRAGSAALDLCDVACGRLDAYYEWGLNPWDLAAGQALVEAAGGRVSDDRGGPHGLFEGAIIASNGIIHDPLVDLLGSVGSVT